MLTRAQYVALAAAVRADPAPLMASSFAITTKGLPGQPPVVPLELNVAQRKLHAALMAQRQEGKPPRAIVLKIRQPGISTYAAGLLMANALTRPYSVNLQVAHLEVSVVQLFQKIRFMYDQLPPELHPEERVSRRTELAFDHLPCSDGPVTLDSRLIVTSAGGGEAWRGMTLHAVHLSEFAQFPRPEETLLGVLQSVPTTPDSLVIIESTARGLNCFQREYDRAASGESHFAAVFIGWHEVPEYTMIVPKGFEPTSEERELGGMLNLTLGQLMWRRYIVQTQCGGNVELFDQEYPYSAAVAFLLSGRPAFPLRQLREMLEVAYKRTPDVGEITVDGGFALLERGRLRVYRRPEPDHDYVVSGDPSSGSQDGDPSCIQVFDRIREEQVAIWHGHVNPVIFARYMMAIGRWYNTGTVAPEVNNHGYTVVEEIKNAQYPRIYIWQRVDRIHHTVSNFYGWETTLRSRPLLIDSMNLAISERSILLVDPETIREHMEFNWLDERRAEGSAGHDDRCLSMLIAYRVHLELPMLSTGIPPRLRFAADPVPIDPDAGLPKGNLNREAWKEADQALAQMGNPRQPDGLIQYLPADGDMGLDEMPDIPF